MARVLSEREHDPLRQLFRSRNGRVDPEIVVEPEVNALALCGRHSHSSITACALALAQNRDRAIQPHQQHVLSAHGLVEKVRLTLGQHRMIDDQVMSQSRQSPDAGVERIDETRVGTLLPALQAHDDTCRQREEDAVDGEVQE